MMMDDMPTLVDPDEYRYNHMHDALNPPLSTGFTPAWANLANLPPPQWLPATPAAMVPAVPVAAMGFPASAPMTMGWPGATPGIGALPPPRTPSRQELRQMTTSSDDEWIRIPSNGTTTSNWDTFPIGPGGPRSLSRADSFRSVTPFSASSSPASRFSSLSRSRSRSKSFVSPKVLEHQKRPPREWRADFRMSPTLTSTLANIVPPGLTRGDSFNSKVHLHKYLRYMSPPQMSWEVREPPEHTVFYALPQTTLWDFSRLAADPPEQHMTLYSPYYPWHVEVNAAHLPGITFHELFAAIWISLNEVITTDDWYNTEMTESIRDKISLAYNIRCGTNEFQRRSGVRRVDFLMERTVLEGFSKGTKGRWEMKLKKST